MIASAIGNELCKDDAHNPTTKLSTIEPIMANFINIVQ